MVKVLKGSAMQPEQQECVQIISSSAKSLLSILNSILDFSKAEAGKTELVVRSHNLAAPVLVHLPLWFSLIVTITSCTL
jgi:signal transduction histidine kinase